MSLRIARLVLREVRLPLVEPFEISSGVTTSRRILLLELEDGDGVSAWSECVAGERPNYSEETIDTAWLALKEWIGPRAVSGSVAHPSFYQARLGANIRGHRMARAAVEMGAWALWSEHEGTSLSRLIGGTRDEVQTGISLGIQNTPRDLAEKSVAAHAAGYQKIKVKIRPGADIEYLAAAREALGRDAVLMADANSAYSLADADHLADLDAYGLAMLEQPLEAGDIRRHATLKDRIATPICLDESITSVARTEDMLAFGGGWIVNIKAGRVAGLTSAIAIHDLCRRSGTPVWCGGMLESGIGRAYNVALASLPNFTIAGDISPSARYWERDIVTPEWTMDGAGRVTVPRDRPGLGVDVDIDRVDDLTVRRKVVRSP